jgi:hypothetical protein
VAGDPPVRVMDKPGTLELWVTQWTEAEWAGLFAALPPRHEARPSWDQPRRVAVVLCHGPDAVLAVWEDAEGYLRGAAYGEASPALRAYLHQRR